MGNRSATAFDLAVAHILKARRIAAGMTQEKAAQAANITFQQVQKYENGTNRLPPGRGHAIAKALGCRLSHIIRDAENLNGS